MQVTQLSADIVIVGGGSGGVAAAWSAATNAPDKKVVLIEAQAVLGGTSTLGGVNAWEPGCVGNSQLHRILYEQLSRQGKAHVSRYHSVSSRAEPFVVAHVDRSEEQNYEESYTRKGNRRIIYEGTAMIQAIENCLYALPNLMVITNCPLIDVEVQNGRIASVIAGYSRCGDTLEIKAPLYIDCTSEIVLARMAGCKTEISSTPNGISQMYVVEKKNIRAVESVPAWVKDTDAPEWIKKNNPDTIFNHYPDGRLNVNTLCTMEGEEYLKLGKEAKQIAIARTYMIWNALQKERGMDEYQLVYMFPMLGIREGHRLVGKYVLDENEMLKGHNFQQKRDHFIAVADHAIDVHGNKDAVLQELDNYYGVPYECTLTNEIENLAVASRGISLTKIAAASCRLQRTIMQIGESVGMAAAKCISGTFYQDNIFIEHNEERERMMNYAIS